jgi:hypothetical protein
MFIKVFPSNLFAADLLRLSPQMLRPYPFACYTFAFINAKRDILLALYSKREAVPFPYFCFGYRRIFCFVSLRAFNANRSILLTFASQREAVFFSYATQSAAYMNFIKSSP